MDLKMSSNAPMAHAEPSSILNEISSTASRRRAVLAATIGNTLEWYDFLIYGFLAATIGKLFFPAEQELTSLLLSVATFGVGAIMRPVAGVVLGIYADRIGRKAALTLTIFIMGLGTGLIAIAPTYGSIGIWAPITIVIARLLQGIACGGELGGATAILVENAPPRRRGFYASWQTSSQAAGIVLGTMTTMVVSLSMTPAELQAGGWRWPFAIGLLVVPVGLYVRSALDEPEPFLKARRDGLTFSFGGMVRGEYRALLSGIGISVLYLACAYVLFVYMPTYVVRELRLSFPQALLSTAIAGLVVFAFSPIFGLVSDRYGRKSLLLIGALGFGLMTYPAFMLILAQPSFARLAAVQSGFALGMAMYAGPAISVYAELFPTHVRSTAVSVIYGFTAALVGGFAPFIVTWLIAVTGNPLAPAFYVVVAAAVSTATLVTFRDRFDEPLR